MLGTPFVHYTTSGGLGSRAMAEQRSVATRSFVFNVGAFCYCSKLKLKGKERFDKVGKVCTGIISAVKPKVALCNQLFM